MRHEPSSPSEESRELRLPALLTVFNVAAAVTLRFATLSRQALWGDEGFTWSVAHASPAALLSPEFDERNPVLYYLLVHPIVLWQPQSEFWVRFPSALASAGFLALVAVLAWRWLHPRAAPWAAALAGVSSFELLIAQDARTYSILNLCWLGAIALILESWRKNAVSLLVLGLFVNALLPALHAVGIVAAAANLAIAIGLAIKSRDLGHDRVRRLALLTGIALVLLSIAAFDASLLASVAEGSASATVPGPSGIKDWFLAVGAGLCFAPAAAPGTGMSSPLPPLVGSLAAFATWGLAASGFLMLVSGDSQSRTLASGIGVSLLSPAVVVGVGGWLLAAPTWVPRLFSIHVALLALGIASCAWRRPASQRIFIAILMAALATANWSSYFGSWSKGPGQLLRSAVPRALGSTDAVVVDFGQAPMALFYFPATQVWSVAHDRAPASADWVRRIRLGGSERAKVRRPPEPCRASRVTDLWFWPGALPLTEMRARLPPACTEGRATWAWLEGRWSPID